MVLEGEGLVNDATALILYRFAVAAISTGVFSLPQAAGDVRASSSSARSPMESAVGWLSLHLRRWVNDPRVEVTLSLMTPYLAYWVPEHLGGSGVLATVAAGLYVSWNGPLLIPLGDAPAGHLLLGPDHLPDRGLDLPGDGLAGARAARAHAAVFAARRAPRNRRDRADHRGGALRLDLSGDLPAALADPVARPPRPVAAVAMGVRARLHRRARRGLARRRAGDSAHARQRSSRFRIATSSCSSRSASSSSPWWAWA